MPEGAPARLGLDDSPPEDIVGQTLWPVSYFLSRRANALVAD